MNMSISSNGSEKIMSKKLVEVRKDEKDVAFNVFIVPTRSLDPSLLSRSCNVQVLKVPSVFGHSNVREK